MDIDIKETHEADIPETAYKDTREKLIQYANSLEAPDNPYDFCRKILRRKHANLIALKVELYYEN